MMKRAIVGVVFTVSSICVAYAEKPDKAAKIARTDKHVTGKYLLKRGYTEILGYPREWYVLKHARLGDVLRDLGLPRAALGRSPAIDRAPMCEPWG